MKLNHRREYNRSIRAWLLKVASFAARLDRASLAARDCPVCASRRKKPFAHNGALAYARCEACSLVYMDPAFPPEVLDRGFRGEDALLREYFRIVRRYKTGPVPKPDPRRDGQLRDIYRLKRGGRLLDVGCSFGDFLAKASYFYDVEGVEVNPETAAVAARRFRVHRGFLHELRLPRVYDIATLNQILYGASEPVRLLEDIAAVLKSGGLLYINTPNADSHAMRLFGGKANHLYGYTTRNVFNRRSLEALASRTGFRVVSFRTEWLDIYLADILALQDDPDSFIHKRNSHRPGYEATIRREDAFHAGLGLDLGERGNYLVSVLRKA